MTNRIKVVIVFLQIAVLPFLLLGCSTKVILNVSPVSLTESKDKINFSIVFAHADDLEEFRFDYKIFGEEAYSESTYIDNILYDGDIQEDRSYRYASNIYVGKVSAGNILRRNAETVFKNLFNEATTLHIPGDDHFAGIIVDHQSYKEIVPSNTVGIMKLRSPEVRFYADFKKPPAGVDKPIQIAELVAEWVLVDLEGNEIWSNTIVGSGLYDYGIWDSLKTLTHELFQPAVDDHFRNLAHAIEESPEIRLFESCLQLGCDRLLANPSSLSETLDNIQNSQNRNEVTNRFVYMAIEEDNMELLKELLSLDYIDINIADKYYQRLPIHLAVQKNNLKATELLITIGSAINIADNKGFSPLHHAASNGYTRITDLLIQKGADVNAKNSEGQTPFILAITNGHQNDWQLLLDNGSNDHAIDNIDLLSTAERYNSIGLYYALRNNKGKSTETFKIASEYYEKASQLYRRASRRAETEAFLKDIFEFSALVFMIEYGSPRIVDQAYEYLRLKALNDASEMRLSQTQTLALMRAYKDNAPNSGTGLVVGDKNRISSGDNKRTSPVMFRKAHKKSIANYYSSLSDICHNVSNDVQSILKCYEEQGAQFKECIPGEIGQ